MKEKMAFLCVAMAAVCVCAAAERIVLEGTNSFGSVVVEKGGKWNLRLETMDTEIRTIGVRTNGGGAELKQVVPGYDKSVGTTDWVVELKEGVNSIALKIPPGAEKFEVKRAILTRQMALADTAGRYEVDISDAWEYKWGKKERGNEWKEATLPHDVQFEQPWGEKDSSAARGYKPMGEAWYRREFTLESLPCAVEGKRVLVEFGAIMAIGDVFVNGRKVASTDYGYLGAWADVTDLLQATNTIEVWCSTGPKSGSRWYTGAGLVNDARIVVKPEISIARHGLFVTGETNGAVRASVELDGFKEKGRNIALDVEVRVEDAKGRVVAEAKARAPYSKLSHQEVLLPEMKIAEPELWDVDAPNLYTCKARLVADGTAIDEVAERFGLRKIEMDSAYGLKLNGRKVFINSMSNHHDLGAVGAAAFPRAIKRQFQTMKKFGYNAIRCSHNPYSKAFYDIADEKGVLVMDELIDKWSDKNYWGGRKPFTTIWPQLVTEWMKRDRNHPSIFAWSFGNELQMREDICGYPELEDWGVTMYRVIKAFSQRWDTTRPTTVAMFPARAGAISRKDKGFNDDPAPPELACATDFAAFNYVWRDYASYVEKVPGLNIFQSEASVRDKQAAYFGMDREHTIGCSYWGAIEYWGESSGWPKKGWNYSFFSHTLAPYPLAWLIKSAMTDEPVCRIAVETGRAENETWNDIAVGTEEEISAWEGKDGEKKKVKVYTNAQEVELLLDGKTIASRKNDKTVAKYRNVVEFEVPFAAGELAAVAKNGGVEVARHSVRTAGEAVRIEIEVENADDFHAGGKDLLYVWCRAVDKNGTVVRKVAAKTAFTCEGAAEFYACDNGDHCTNELFTPETSEKNMAGGEILAIFRAGKESGEARIAISAEGFEPQNIAVQVK